MGYNASAVVDALIFRSPISWETTLKMARESFEDMVKFVVDVQRKVLCAGGGLHSDQEQLLLEDGSLQENLWGGNYYWQDTSDGRFEYTSMINLRPTQGNPSQQIQSQAIRRQVRDLAVYFFESAR